MQKNKKTRMIFLKSFYFIFFLLASSWKYMWCRCFLGIRIIWVESQKYRMQQLLKNKKQKLVISVKSFTERSAHLSCVFRTATTCKYVHKWRRWKDWKIEDKQLPLRTDRMEKTWKEWQFAVNSFIRVSSRPDWHRFTQLSHTHN